jgi:hypothetical protein
MAEKKIVARECRFAWHIPAKGYGEDDFHYVKEVVHFEDGTSEPRTRLIKNFQRPFWITKASARNHQQKREWEYLENLNKFECTQSQLRDEIAKALNMRWSKDHYKKLAASPYLYGSDITSTALVKKMYQDKWSKVTKFSVSTFDIESDVTKEKGTPGYEEPIMATLVFKDKLLCCTTEEYVARTADIHARFQEKVDKYIGTFLEKRAARVELIICKDVTTMLRTCIMRAHDWKPDFFAIWNMDYDIPKVLETLERYGIDPKDVFCDPTLQEDMKICKYIQGPKKKTTASGKVKPLNPAEQWHTLKLTASFYVIDAMCAYKHLRLGEQEESSYSLDAILNKKLGIRKLSFAEADHLEKLAWHRFMQTNFKIEYMVYNNFDSLSMVELDEKTMDLEVSLPTFAGTTDFSNFKSQPKRIMDALHYYLLEEGAVLGTVGPSERTESSRNFDASSDEDDVLDNGDEDEDEEFDEDGNPIDPQTLSLKNWIMTLTAHMQVLGYKCIEEDPTIQTSIRGFVYDSDATAAYPSATAAANVSKMTTARELISIVGVEEVTFRMQNLNMVLGATNALEYTQNMFGFPGPDEMLNAFLKEFPTQPQLTISKEEETYLY